MRISRIALYLVLTSAVVFSQSKTDIPKFIEDADRFTTVTFENQKSLDVLQKADKIDGNNYEILWRISRCYVDIGEHLPSQTDEQKEKQLEYYQKSLDYADKAVAANANGSMGYLRRAIANGRIALFKGVFKAGGYVNKVKEDCEKAIALDPNNSIAYYILGRTHAKLAEKPKFFRMPLGLSWGNWDDALSYYEKAISMRSNFVMYKLDAARAYAERDNYQKAKEYLTQIASFPKQDEDDDQFKKEAVELFNQIKNK